MLNSLKNLWRHNKWLLLGFTAAAMLTLFFAVRMVIFSLYWANPDHQNQPIEGWMTPRYVAFSYDLEREQVALVLGMDPKSVARVKLSDLAKQQGVTIAEFQRRIDTIAAARPNE